MRAQDLLNLLQRRPFRPARLHMSNGNTYDIRHPEMAIVERSGVWIGVPAKGGDMIAEEVRYCSLLHIVEIQPPEDEAVPRQAG